MSKRFSKWCCAAAVIVVLGAPSAQASNLILNGGFEDGVYSNTIDGHTNISIPNDWTENAGYDLEQGFNQVVTAPVHSGTYALSIGNFVNQPAPSLSQTFADVNGVTYYGQIFVQYGGCCGSPGAYFDVLVGNNVVLALDNTAPDAYNGYSFSFVGTGSDTLMLTGNTDPSEWYVDDVSVSDVAATPLPSTWTLMLLGLVGLGFVTYRRSGIPRSVGYGLM